MRWRRKPVGKHPTVNKPGESRRKSENLKWTKEEQKINSKLTF